MGKARDPKTRSHEMYTRWVQATWLPSSLCQSLSLSFLMRGDHNHHKSAKDFQGHWPSTRDSFLFTTSSLPLCWFRGLSLLFNFYLKIQYILIICSPLPNSSMILPTSISNQFYVLSLSRKKEEKSKQTNKTTNKTKPTKSTKSILCWPTAKDWLFP